MSVLLSILGFVVATIAFFILFSVLSLIPMAIEDYRQIKHRERIAKLEKMFELEFEGRDR